MRPGAEAMARIRAAPANELAAILAAGRIDADEPKIAALRVVLRAAVARYDAALVQRDRGSMADGLRGQRDALDAAFDALGRDPGVIAELPGVGDERLR